MMKRMLMDPKLKVVTQLPLRGLWTDSGSVEAVRGRDLSSGDVRELLRNGPVQFVVVDVGQKPRWIELEDCYRFWMDEVKDQLAEPDVQASGVYAYRASEWVSEEAKAPIVVLEVGH